MAVKLHRPTEISDDESSDTPRPIPLKPLAVSGIVITKSALMQALRVYIPALEDIEVVEDGERFVLTLAAPTVPG